MEGKKGDLEMQAVPDPQTPIEATKGIAPLAPPRRPFNMKPRMLTAEFIGTFMFVLLHIGLYVAVISPQYQSVPKPPGFAGAGTPAGPPTSSGSGGSGGAGGGGARLLLQIQPPPAQTASISEDNAVVRYVLFAAGSGALVSTVIYTIAPISGAHFNPAFTVAQIVSGMMDPVLGFLFIVAQLLGGICAGVVALIGLGQGDEVVQNTQLGSCLPSDLNDGVALLSEVVGTFLFLFIVFHVVFWPGRLLVLGPIWPALVVGTGVAGMIIAAMSVLPGLGFNSARCIPPLLLEGSDQAKIWIYLLGDLIAGVAAGLLFRFMTPEPIKKLM